MLVMQDFLRIYKHASKYYCSPALFCITIESVMCLDASSPWLCVALQSKSLASGAFWFWFSTGAHSLCHWWYNYNTTIRHIDTLRLHSCLGIARVKNWQWPLMSEVNDLWNKTFLVFLYMLLKSRDYVFKMSIFKKLSIVLYMYVFILKKS